MYVFLAAIAMAKDLLVTLTKSNDKTERSLFQTTIALSVCVCVCMEFIHGE